MRCAQAPLLLSCLLLAMSAAGLLAQNAAPVLATEYDLKDIQTRAEKNDPQAQTTLGTFYQLGQQGLKTDYMEAMKWFQKAAQQGDPGAMYRIGYLYHMGQGVQKSIPESARWFIKSAAAGFAVAQYTAGTLYRDGFGVNQSDAEALRWFMYAAEQGYAPAQHEVGSFVFLGRGTPPDFIEGCKWFYIASANGYEQSDKALALNLQFLTREQMEGASKLAKEFKLQPPRTVPEKAEPPALYTELLAKANAGDPHAQNQLSLLLQSGKPTVEDLKEARKWLLKAADGGDAEAQHQLGSMYFTGQGGMARNYLAAYKWMALAVEQGRADAQDGLNRVTAVMTPFQQAEARKYVTDYKASRKKTAQTNAPTTVATAQKPTVPAPTTKPESATSVVSVPAPPTPPPNAPTPSPAPTPKPAEVKLPADMEQLRKEADAGKPEAQLAMGLKFLHGQGVNADRAEALKWLEKSANQGHGPAQYWLATTFDVAHQNDRVKWMRRAADSGFGLAQLMVGQMYFTGQGVAQDSIEAYKWLHLASQQGNPAADAFLATVSPVMKQDQIDEAKRRAEEIAFRLKNK